MKKQNKLLLSHKEFVLMGLINEVPSYGYEIEQKIKKRGMRAWTSIGFSSIYHILGKLKKAGFVTQKSRIVNGKLQRVSSLTDEGSQVLNTQIRFSIVRIEPDTVNFDVAISNSICLPIEEIRELLEQRIANLLTSKKSLANIKQEKLDSGTPDLPGIMILFDRPLAMLEAEIDFLQHYIHKF